MKKGKKLKRKWIKWVSAAACFCLIIAATVFAIYKIQNEPGSVVDTDIMRPSNSQQEVIVGPDGKVTTGHKIGIKCLSFYREKTISIDTFMSQMLTSSEKERIEGYPVFEVYQETNEVYENGDVIINGNGNKYEKKFSLDDLKYLVAASMEDDVFDGHSEKVTLDFSSFNPGEIAIVRFSYGFFYYENNPYNESQRDNSWCGMRKALFFYFGENGISVSSNGIEEAVSNYEKCNEKPIDIGHSPDTDSHCSAKAIYQNR